MIKVYLNRKVSETQITIGNQYESGVNAIAFDLSELKEKWPNGNIYLLVSRKAHTWPYSIDDGEFKIEYVLTWKRGFYQMNVVVTDEKITDQLESSNTIFVSDTINAYVNENQINAKALNEQELPRELQIVYDDLITLKKNIEKDLADGKYIGPQGPKGEPGDVTEEYRNLASQIAQNASDAQTSATNAQVSATNAQKALDDTKDFVNQTKTELNQIKTDTSVLKDEANTSAVNAKASETKAKEYADNLKESTDAISQNTKAISELADKKITKFYASNQGEIHITDSDNGKIQDLKIYGQSKQDGEPSPSNPVDIKNVVNPKMSVCGSNILQKHKEYIGNNKFEGNITLNDDGSLSYEGSILEDYASIYIHQLSLKKGTYQLLANQYSVSNNIGAKLIVEKASGNIYIVDDSPSTIDVDDTNCRLFVSSEVATSYPLPVSGIVRCALVYSGSTTEIQPYVEKSVTLPITLNAIPVSSGGNVTINGQQYIADYVDVERGKIVRRVDSSKLDNTQSIIDKTEWLLVEQQETNLTREQKQALSEFATYYHVTNISVTSDQLDGYTVFNYPISLANGWNYVKKQLNDNRDYIYDMDLQSAEAYVNSEYAVTLTELEV